MLKSLTLCFLGAGSAACAQSSPEAITFQSCRVCHGDGAGAGAIPAIAGRSYEDLLGYLTALDGPSDTSTIMHQFTAGLTDAEIEALARYISEREGIDQ